MFNNKSNMRIFIFLIFDLNCTYNEIVKTVVCLMNVGIFANLVYEEGFLFGEKYGNFAK